MSNRMSSSLRESYERKMMLEFMDKRKFKEASDLIKSLNKISTAAKAGNTTYLVDTLKKASDDINKFTGGQGLTAALMKQGLTWLNKKATDGKAEDPITKVQALVSVLKEGFEEIETVIKTVVPNYNAKSSAAGKKGNFPASSPLGQADPSVQEKLVDAVASEFVPGGAFAQLTALFSKQDTIPYVESVFDLCQSILSTPADKLSALAKAARTAQYGDPIVDDEKSKKSVPKETNSPQTVKNYNDLARVLAAAQAKEKGKDPKAEVADAIKDVRSFTNRFVDYVAAKSNQDVKVVKSVLNVVLKKERLKVMYDLKEDRHISNDLGILTAAAAEEALQIYLESGGSSRRWVDLMLNEGQDYWLPKLNLIKKKISDGADIDDVVSDLRTAIDGTTVSKDRKELKNGVVNAIAKKTGKDRKDVYASLEARLDKVTSPEEKTDKKSPDEDTKDDASDLKRDEEDTDAKKSEKATGKYSDIANELADALEDVTPAMIVSVLQAFPEYFILESLRRRNLQVASANRHLL